MEPAIQVSWPATGLRPLAATLFGIPAVVIVIAAASRTVAPVVGVGGIVIVKWTIAWLLCLPRRAAVSVARP